MSIISALIILPVSFTTNSALSATTSKTIQGTAPRLKSASQENRLGFTVGGKFYSESSNDTATTEQIKSETIKKFTGSLKFSDFKVKTLTADDFSVSTDYEDSDGDIAKTSGAFIVGATEYEWKDAKGVVIANTTNTTNLSKGLGCGSGYSLPLSLEIKADVVVHSEYGDPSKSEAKKLTKVYQIVDSNAVCFAKADLSWHGNAATPDQYSGGGYSSDFDPVNGFRASASPTFPTTGFPGAQFQLVMTGAQEDWKYSIGSSHTNDIVTVDATGNVLLKKKPSGEVTVRATLKANNNVYNDYKFTPTTNGWFVPQSGTYTYAKAINTCGSANIPTRVALTNSPKNTGSSNQGWTYVPNFYSRAIGTGIFSEWGYLDEAHYPSSQWFNGGYWTQDIYTNSIQFVVFSSIGAISFSGTSNYYNAVCRE